MRAPGALVWRPTASEGNSVATSPFATMPHHMGFVADLDGYVSTLREFLGSVER